MAFATLTRLAANLGANAAAGRRSVGGTCLGHGDGHGALRRESGAVEGSESEREARPADVVGVGVAVGSGGQAVVARRARLVLGDARLAGVAGDARGLASLGGHAGNRLARLPL